MTDFVAIDFETANAQPCSVCSVGVVIVRNGMVVDTYYSLIHPEPDYYSYFFRLTHGLGPADTDSAPVFPVVWAEIERRVIDAFAETPDAVGSVEELAPAIPFVAHNAAFDEKCLRSVFRVYQMTYPDYLFYDTLRASRRWFGRSLPNHQLHTVSQACGYDLVHHHHALSDAEACAAIALVVL